MSIRVLIADDHAIVLDGLRAALGAAPDINIVAQARTGNEAVRRAIDLRPDVAVMEVALPELNGIDATQEIRQACPSCKVVILSMHTAAEYVYRALRAGAGAYVVKAGDSAEVSEAIRAVHAGSRYLSRKITDVVIDDIVTGVDFRSPLDTLSARERQVIQLVVESKTSAEIGKILSLSVKTIDTYRSRLMQKLGVEDLPELVKFAIRHGLTSVEPSGVPKTVGHTRFR
ncbi:MAG: response regulator [Burkholderiales bacterium]